MKKLSIIAVAITMVLLSTNAQQNGHYLSIDGGGGLETFYSTFNEPYKDGGTQNLGFGGRFNFKYTYFISSNWGVGLGVGFHTLSSTLGYNGLDNFNTKDTDGEEYLRLTTYDNVMEKQHSWVFDIPVSVAYQIEMAPKWNFILDLGIKVSIPILTDYRTISGTITTQGYYESTHATLYSGYYDLTRHGLSTYPIDSSDKYRFDILASAFVNINFAYEMARNCEFFFGLYADYGFNNLKKNTTSHAFTPSYSDQNRNVFNGFMNSTMINKVNSISAGPQIGFRFRVGD